jgi:AbrB family looped-hinge helix DNA binding protein
MPKIVGASKVTSRYQVTIPREVRSKLKIAVGDTLVFVVQGDIIYITTNV